MILISLACAPLFPPSPTTDLKEAELGFTWVDDGCDGYCPGCEQKDSCETAAEIGWDDEYS